MAEWWKNIHIPDNAPPCWEYTPKPHSYTMNCICLVCAQETHRRLSQFWQMPPTEQKETKRQLKKTIPHQVELF